MKDNFDYFIVCVILGLLIFTVKNVKSINRTVEAMATAMQVEAK